MTGAQPAFGMGRCRQIPGPVPLPKALDDGSTVGLVDVAPVLELGNHFVNRKHHSPDAPEPGGVRVVRISDRGSGLDGSQLATQDRGYVFRIGADFRPTSKLNRGIVGRRYTEQGVLVADRLPVRRDEGPVSGYREHCLGILGESVEDGVGDCEVSKDLLPIQDELGWDYNGPDPSGSWDDQVTEALCLDEGAPFRLTQGPVDRRDMHARSLRVVRSPRVRLCGVIIS